MRRRAASIIANAGVVLVSALLGLALLEIAFRVYPEAFPDNLRALIETDDASRLARKAIVERLAHSPFAKPYPNVDVFIPGYYGPKDAFVYEWRSDRRGFKNLPEIAAHDRVDVVAVGDSFTEGMGVEIADTWASRLSAKGYLTYNLGIQGYAPTQFLGAYEHFGRRLSPKWVVIGLLGNVYMREQRFLGEVTSGTRLDKSALGAIGRLQEQDELNAQRPLYIETRDGWRVPVVVRTRHRFVTSAVVALAAHRIHFALNFKPGSGVPDQESDVRFTSKSGFARYDGETSWAATEIDQVALVHAPEWRGTERTLERLAALAKQDGARVLLVFFPQRGTAYFKAATGRALPAQAFDLVQARAARAFAERHDLHFLDMTPALEAAASTLVETSSVESYPYLKIDGHPSPLGHEIIATEIARLLSRE